LESLLATPASAAVPAATKQQQQQQQQQKDTPVRKGTVQPAAGTAAAAAGGFTLSDRYQLPHAALRAAWPCLALQQLLVQRAEGFECIAGGWGWGGSGGWGVGRGGSCVEQIESQEGGGWLHCSSCWCRQLRAAGGGGC
jgi:hypothetical protein